MVKWNGWWLLALAAGLAAGPTIPVAAADEDTPEQTTVGAGAAANGDATTANSVADFDLEGGTLALVAVPVLHFERASVAELINGSKTLKTQGELAPQLQVNDYRGSNAGWQVTAKLGAFQLTGAADRQLIADSIQLGQATVTGDNTATLAIDSKNFSGIANTVLAAPQGKGSGQTSAKIAAAALTLPQDVTILAGNYEATIDWTLTAAPQATQP